MSKIAKTVKDTHPARKRLFTEVVAAGSYRSVSNKYGVNHRYVCEFVERGIIPPAKVCELLDIVIDPSAKILRDRARRKAQREELVRLRGENKILYGAIDSILGNFVMAPGETYESVYKDIKEIAWKAYSAVQTAKDSR